MNSTKLQELTNYMEATSCLLHSILIIPNGYIVYEENPRLLYDVNSLHVIYFVNKSITSAFFKIAITESYDTSVNEILVCFFRSDHWQREKVESGGGVGSL